MKTKCNFCKNHHWNYFYSVNDDEFKFFVDGELIFSYKVPKRWYEFWK